MAGKIVVVGSLNMDLVVRSPHLPAAGETVLGHEFATFPGGKGANQAAAAARLGGEVAMIGRVGADAYGDALLAALARDRVDTRAIRRDPAAATGVGLITVDDRAENSIVVVSGANMRVTPEDVLASENRFEGASVLLVQLEIPPATSRAAIELAHRHGLRVLLNPAPAQALPAGFLAGVDFLLPNEGELLSLTGETSQAAAIQTARANGAGALVVTLGERGALLVEDFVQTLVPAYRVKAVDTTAAGDAFVGAFAVSLAEGKPALEAARFACAAAAISVTRAGAMPSLPERGEVDAFLNERAGGGKLA